jgi:hypothetical protein
VMHTGDRRANTWLVHARQRSEGARAKQNKEQRAKHGHGGWRGGEGRPTGMETVRSGAHASGALKPRRQERAVAQTSTVCPCFAYDLTTAPSHPPSMHSAALAAASHHASFFRAAS